MTDIGAKIAAAKSKGRPRGSVDICLDPDINDEMEELVVKQSKPAKLGDSLSAEWDALKERAEESTITLEFQAVHPLVWEGLLVDNPPNDKGGFTHEFWVAAIKRCCTSDVTDEQWETLMGSPDPDDENDGLLSSFYWDALAEKVFSLNRRGSLVPFTKPASSPTED